MKVLSLPGVLNARVVALPAGVAQLQNIFTVMAMDRFTYFAPERDLIVAVDHGVIRQDAAPNMHAGTNDDDDRTHNCRAAKRLLPVRFGSECLNRRSYPIGPRCLTGRGGSSPLDFETSAAGR